MRIAIPLAMMLVTPAAAQELSAVEARVRAAEPGPVLDRVLRSADAGLLFALYAADARGDLEPLGGGREAALRAALVGPRGDDLVRALWPLADAPYVEPDRRLAVVLAGEIGGPDEMPLALALAARGAPEPTPARVKVELERAVLRMLAREPRGLEGVPTMVAEAPADLLEGLIRSAGAIGRRPALEALSASLGRRDAAEMRLLAEIETVAALGPHPADAAVRARVRRYLTASDPLQRVAAIGACAALEDVDALPFLCDTLRDPVLAGFTEPALRRITGKDFKRNAPAWEAWIAEEVAWWEGPGRESLRALAHGGAEVAAAP